MKYCIIFPISYFCDFINVLAFQSGILGHAFCTMFTLVTTCLSSQNILENLLLCELLKSLSSKKSVLDEKCFDFKWLIRSAYKLVEAPFISLAGRLKCGGSPWDADTQNQIGISFISIILYKSFQ